MVHQPFSGQIDRYLVNIEPWKVLLFYSILFIVMILVIIKMQLQKMLRYFKNPVLESTLIKYRDHLKSMSSSISESLGKQEELVESTDLMIECTNTLIEKSQGQIKSLKEGSAIQLAGVSIASEDLKLTADALKVATDNLQLSNKTLMYSIFALILGGLSVFSPYLYDFIDKNGGFVPANKIKVIEPISQNRNSESTIKVSLSDEQLKNLSYKFSIDEFITAFKKSQIIPTTPVVPSNSESKSYDYNAFQKLRKVVAKNGLNMRQGPSKKTKIIFTLQFDQTVFIIQKRQQWFLVKHLDYHSGENVEGWVFAKYLKGIM